MALEVTQVHRNLHQRVTWLYLEIEDMFLVLGLGVLANFIGRFLGPLTEILETRLELLLACGVFHFIDDSLRLLAHVVPKLP